MGLWVSLLGQTMYYGWSPNAIVKVLPLNFFSLKKNVIRNLEFQGGHSNLTLKADNKNLLKVISYLCLVKSKLVDFRYLNRALLLHRLELFQRIECISLSVMCNSFEFANGFKAPLGFGGKAFTRFRKPDIGICVVPLKSQQNLPSIVGLALRNFHINKHCA